MILKRISIYFWCLIFILINNVVSSEEKWLQYTDNPGKCYRKTTTYAIWNGISKLTIGNGSDPNIVVIEKCCEGFKEYKYNKSQCIPECGDKCENGFCTSPGICECFPGFVKSTDGKCVHKCPLGCLNGKCHANGVCTCNDGFAFINSDKLLCVPVCSNGCAWREKCVAPNKCDCVEGYKKNNKTSLCEPVCDPPCGYGSCSFPGKCFCHTGYYLINKTCPADCTKGCDGGICSANNLCSCYPGWKLSNDGNKCLPYCSSDCENGSCKQPEVCECNEGYQLIENKCQPICKPDCGEYGKCIKPNTCQCADSYVWVKNKCMKLASGYAPKILVTLKPPTETTTFVNSQHLLHQMTTAFPSYYPQNSVQIDTTTPRQYHQYRSPNLSNYNSQNNYQVTPDNYQYQPKNSNQYWASLNKNPTVQQNYDLSPSHPNIYQTSPRYNNNNNYNKDDNSHFPQQNIQNYYQYRQSQSQRQNSYPNAESTTQTISTNSRCPPGYLMDRNECYKL